MPGCTETFPQRGGGAFVGIACFDGHVPVRGHGSSLTGVSGKAENTVCVRLSVQRIAKNSSLERIPSVPQALYHAADGGTHGRSTPGQLLLPDLRPAPAP